MYPMYLDHGQDKNDIPGLFSRDLVKRTALIPKFYQRWFDLKEFLLILYELLVNTHG